MKSNQKITTQYSYDAHAEDHLYFTLLLCGETIGFKALPLISNKNHSLLPSYSNVKCKICEKFRGGASEYKT